jgi:hypothetical protein
MGRFEIVYCRFTTTELSKSYVKLPRPSVRASAKGSEDVTGILAGGQPIEGNFFKILFCVEWQCSPLPVGH